MNKIILMLAAVLLALSATTVQSMDGHADRVNEAKTYPNKTVVMMDDHSKR
ncbi:MAG: hypothetical protein ABJM19_05485 [Marinobacter sp.]|uniref:hypothetical protein n=1 Tax=Marinobacter sp. TaxID=50741 RepID=UPI00329A69DB